jgi:hypothetical protein
MEKTIEFALKEAYGVGYEDGISSVVKAAEEDFKTILEQVRNAN